MDEKILQALAVLKKNRAKWFKRTTIVEYRDGDGDWRELDEDQPIRLLWQYELRIVDRTPK